MTGSCEAAMFLVIHKWRRVCNVRLFPLGSPSYVQSMLSGLDAISFLADLPHRTQ
jgi:hypothetical protein